MLWNRIQVKTGPCIYKKLPQQHGDHIMIKVAFKVDEENMVVSVYGDGIRGYPFRKKIKL